LTVSTIIFNTTEKKERYYQKMREMDCARCNTFGYVAAIEAYKNGEDWMMELRDYLDSNLQFLHDYCEKNIPGVSIDIPEATYLAWVDLRGLGMNQKELKEFCAQKAGIGMNDGTVFGEGGEGFMRLNAACPRSTLEKAMKQLEQAVKAL